MSGNTNKLLSEQDCMELMLKCNMLPNIIAHSVQVKNVALAITDNLLPDTNINRRLVTSGALLHDISKTRSIQEKLHNHDEMGGKFLRSLGLIDEAVICENHVKIKDFDENSPLTESEIVCYSDKRVKHDKVVSLEERIQDLIARYGTTPEKIKYIEDSRDFMYRLEAKIVKFMSRDMAAALVGL